MYLLRCSSNQVPADLISLYFSDHRPFLLGVHVKFFQNPSTNLCYDTTKLGQSSARRSYGTAQNFLLRETSIYGHLVKKLLWREDLTGDIMLSHTSNYCWSGNLLMAFDICVLGASPFTPPRLGQYDTISCNASCLEWT